MKHDENKIEEVIEYYVALVSELFDEDGNNVSKGVRIAMKQYAEHMVQQIVEKIEEMNQNSYSVDKEYPIKHIRQNAVYQKACRDIINLINK